MSDASTEHSVLPRERRLRDVIDDCLAQRAIGQPVIDAEVMAKHPDLMPELAEELAKMRLISAVARMASRGVAVDDSLISTPDKSLLPEILSQSAFESGEVGQNIEAESTGESQLPELHDYRIVRELHSGGQGVVYEAVQLSTRRTVAIKILLEGPTASRRSQQRFEREIELIASLRHPHVVAIHDSGITRGQYYYAMDYVRGQPLDTHIRLAKPDVKALMKLFKTTCDAVAYAHRMGVIHRDLKPSNILVDMEGNPVILDFGLARIMGTQDHASLTMPGVLLGTVPYMSPEQTLGTPEAIDTRTDVYALGVILYELLTGITPYTTRGVDLAKAFDNIRNVDPPKPSKWTRESNHEIDAIVLKAMEKDVDRRYSSANEMSEDIAAWLEGRPIQAKSASTLYVIRKHARQHIPETLGIFATVLAIMASFYAAGLSSAKAKQAEIQQRESEQALGNQGAHYGRMHDEQIVALRHAEFGWFISEWESGRLEAAQALTQRMPAGTPERVAMEFLLDSNQSFEQLFANLPFESAPLAHFVAAERFKQNGQFTAASREFDLVITQGQMFYDSWIRRAATARMAELRAKLPTSGPTSAESSESRS